MTVRGRPSERQPPRPARVPPADRPPPRPARVSPATCAARPPCPDAPCFLVELHPAAGSGQAGRDATACASHLGEVVCDVATWAHEHGAAGGEVTVLAIDPSPPGDTSATSGEPGPGFAFGSIPLGPPGG